MFTGLIRQTGRLHSLQAARIVIECPALIQQLVPGDSVAVNGVCMTVTELAQTSFGAALLPQTYAATTFSSIKPGRRLNLELPLTAGARFDGHFVQGHVDGVVLLMKKQAQSGGTWEYTFELPGWLAKLVFAKCSIALDGVSLTVQNIQPDKFSVALIPATYNETALSDIPVGGGVNVEADMLVKAVQRAVEAAGQQQSLTLNDLKELGYGG